MRISNRTHIFLVFIFFVNCAHVSSARASLPPHLNFEVSPPNTRWLEAPPPGSTPSILTIYRSPEIYKGVQATLTVRKDLASGEFKTLAKYTRKWLSEFPRFGYKIVNSKTFEHNGAEGFLADLKAKDANKLIRQVVFLRDPDAIIFTCTDHKDRFNVSLTACMSIIHSFRWKDEAKKDSH